MAKPKCLIEFHPAAIREIRDAIQWYRDRDERAGAELRTLIAAAEELVQRSPESWAAYFHGTRGFRFQQYPFVLAYVIRGETVFVVALAHTSLKPGYWRERLD
jgi:plasmid stabilization system protein ParE